MTALNAIQPSSTDEDLELIKSGGQTRKWSVAPFPIDENINKKVVLYDGGIELLRADAIVNPTNENLTLLNLVNKLAGPELESYIKKRIRVCSTGDVRVTPGFRSNFKFIIHAVPPKYQPKYRTAAETALFHSYFRILETMIEKGIRTVVMPTLTTPKCNLPIDDNIHMQLRIIRRILEKKGDQFDKIVVSVADAEQYSGLFYCYFPQSSVDEEIACYRLGTSIGGQNGEPVIPEREIRIKSKPAILDPSDKSIDLTSGLDLSTVVGNTAFSRMHDDPGRERKGFNKKAAVSNQIVVRKTILRGCTLL